MKLLKRHVPLLLLLLVCVLVVGLKLEFFNKVPSDDYPSYYDTARVFAHAIPAIPKFLYPSRILKPLAPIGIALLAPLAGGFINGFWAEAVIFYFLFVTALYALGYAFFENTRAAFFTGFIGAFSYPMLIWGLNLFTETGAQFFYVLSLLYSLQYLKAPSRRLLYGNAAVIAIALLWKEYAIVSGLIFGVILMIEHAPWRARIQNILLFGAIALIPSALWQLYVYHAYHYTYLDWYRVGGASGFTSGQGQYSLGNLASSFGLILSYAWVLVPFGLLRLKELSPARRRFLLIATVVPLIELAWGYVSERLLYVIAPPLILIAVLALGYALPPRGEKAYS